MSQVDDFDYVFKGENSREEDVENVQDVGDVISYFVMVDSYSDYVQEYYNYYVQVKFGVYGDIVEDGLDSSLKRDINIK